MWYNKKMTLLRRTYAAKYLGVHPATLNEWAKAKKIPFVWSGGERRYNSDDLDAFLGKAPASSGPRIEAFYTRVSGSNGQETSLQNQEKELRDTSAGTLYKVYKDRASGLREDRTGLKKMLKDACDHKFSVLRVTHEDRLARFGVVWIKALLEHEGVSVEVLHTKSLSAMDELLQDFISLVSTFSGRLYGLRGAAQKSKLLQIAQDEIANG